MDRATTILKSLTSAPLCTAMTAQLASAIAALRAMKPVYAALVLTAAAYLFIAVAAVAFRWYFKTGTVVRQRFYHDPQHPQDLYHIAGDQLFNAIVDEMFRRDGEHAYLKHGVQTPTKMVRAAPALVVDVGANCGLFGVSMQQLCEADRAEFARADEFAAAAAAVAVAAGAGVGGKKKGSTEKAAAQRSPSAARRTASASRKSALSPSAAAATAAVAALVAGQGQEQNGSNGVADPDFPMIRVIAFEPIPENFECAEKNMQLAFSKSNAAHPAVASKVYPIGIGKEAAEATFHYDPGMGAGASMVKSEMAAPMKREGVFRVLSAVITDVANLLMKYKHPLWNFPWFVVGGLLTAWAKLLRVPLLNVAVFVATLPFMLAFLVWRVCSAPAERAVTCEIETLPRALEKAGAGDPRVSIAFLKIDVEGAEEQVIDGMDDATWARTHQLVVEVHQTADGRVERLCALFKKKGFKSITVDVEDFEMHRLMDIRTVFATR